MLDVGGGTLWHLSVENQTDLEGEQLLGPRTREVDESKVVFERELWQRISGASRR